jgi:hypothetical protein
VRRPLVERRPTSARIRSYLVVTAALIGLATVSGCASATSATSGASHDAAPLAATSTTSTGTWAVVPMGHLNQHLNTFWQLFVRPTDSSKWTLVTPRGVADNGGLVMTTGPDPDVTVGFLTSQNLSFSPVARTSDEGGSWSPGVISAALTSDPDVLASGSGDSYAVVRSGGGRILTTTASDQASWRTLVSRTTLGQTADGQSCGIGPLTALTVGGSGRVLVGADCARGGVVGIFGERQGRWGLVGPHVSRSTDSTMSTVLRLVTTESGVSTLLSLDTGGLRRIVAAWSESGTGPWTQSRPLATGASDRIVSTGIGPDGGFLIETSAPNGALRLFAITGPAATWRELDSPPAGTKAVAVAAGGPVDALSVSNSRLTAWGLASSPGPWRREQTIDVPIFYGSSD